MDFRPVSGLFPMDLEHTDNNFTDRSSIDLSTVFLASSIIGVLKQQKQQKYFTDHSVSFCNPATLWRGNAYVQPWQVIRPYQHSESSQENCRKLNTGPVSSADAVLMQR